MHFARLRRFLSRSIYERDGADVQIARFFCIEMLTNAVDGGEIAITMDVYRHSVYAELSFAFSLFPINQ